MIFWGRHLGNVCLRGTTPPASNRQHCNRTCARESSTSMQSFPLVSWEGMHGALKSHGNPPSDGFGAAQCTFLCDNFARTCRGGSSSKSHCFCFEENNPYKTARLRGTHQESFERRKARHREQTDREPPPQLLRRPRRLQVRGV